MHFLEFLPAARNAYTELEDEGSAARLVLGYATARGENAQLSRFSFAVFGHIAVKGEAAMPTVEVLRGRREAIGTGTHIYGPANVEWSAGSCILSAEGQPTWVLPTESAPATAATFTDSTDGAAPEQLTVINLGLVKPNSNLSQVWDAFTKGPAGEFDGYMPNDLDALIARIQQGDTPPPMPALPLLR